MSDGLLELPTSGVLDGLLELPTSDPSICAVGGHGLFLPLGGDSEQRWSIELRQFLYLFGLLWCFVGVAIVADTFMAAIEKITSAEKILKLKTTTKDKDGKEVVSEKDYHVKVWNDTIANLTLMALGSSAPEILLSIIEILANKMQSGALGPSTIVGSAAFNLMVICAVCVCAIPDGEVRRIKDMGVFSITAVFSVFAYLWLVVILQFWTPNVVTLVETIITFLFFPILVTLAYLADSGYFKSHKKVSPKVLEVTTEGGMSKAEKADIIRKVRAEFGDDLSDEEMQQCAQIVSSRSEKKSRAHYRVKATRDMFGGKSVTAPEIVPSSVTAKKNAAAKQIQFKNSHEKVAENEKSIKIEVVRAAPLTESCTVQYKTQDIVAPNSVGTINGPSSASIAKAGEDYVASEGTVTFAVGSATAEISIELKDDDKVEPDEQFSVVLSNPSTGVLGPQEVCIITILNDDLPGIFGFECKDKTGKPMARYSATEGELVEITVVRNRGVCGDVSVQYKTIDETAKGGSDFDATEGTLQFKAGQVSASFHVQIHDDEAFEKLEHFKIELSNGKLETGESSEFKEWAWFAQDTNGGSESEIIQVQIVNDDAITNLGDVLENMMNRDNMSLASADYAEQFKLAVDVRGGDPDANVGVMTWFGHILSLPWKVFFALIPPTAYCGGWMCFGVALGFIGFVTAIIADLASLLGCVMGLNDAVTAITFVALGTSLPDTFASMASAVGDEYADNSIGNVTGSNSVNVFLGLGLPWLIAAAHWTALDCGLTQDDANTDAYCVTWWADYGGNVANGDIKEYGFVVLAGDLVTSVVTFCVVAVTTLCTLVWRRDNCGGELGGPKKSKQITGVFFVFLWFVYVTVSCLVTYKKLDAI